MSAQLGLARSINSSVRLAPLGLFALSAAAAGTLRIEELSRLQAYLIMFGVACAMAAFGILPALVSSVTPIRYREFIAAVQEPVLIAIATGKLFVTLPQITKNCEDLLRRDDEMERTSGVAVATVLVPLAYPFPHLGKTLAFVFIPFAAWYTGQELTTVHTLGIAAAGTVSSFASPLVTMPYMLDQHQLPQDLMSLFILPGFITMRMGDVVGMVHLMALTVIVAQFQRGHVHLRWKRLVMASSGLLLCLVVAVGASRWYLASTTLKYDLDQRFLALEIPSAHKQVVVYRDRADVPDRPLASSTLVHIRDEKSIRVGYSADAKPYCFFNQQQSLVGLDIELMHRLAERLQIRLEFVPYTSSTAEEQLSTGEIDVIVGGVILMPERLLRGGFTQPYQSATLAVVTRDHRRGEFDTWEQLRKATDLRLGAQHEDMAAAARRYLPDAQVEVVESAEPFFSGTARELDGVIMAAEIGSIWNILYPNHTVVVPRPAVRRPVSMVVRADDQDWLRLLDGWLDFERLDGSLDRLRTYWIEGGGTQNKPARWCVLRDVLHWIPQ